MTILQEADSLINGDRAEAYGNADENLQNVANMWAAYLWARHHVSFELLSEDVCWMMALLKMCRQMHKHSDENLIDACGYIGLVEKVTDRVAEAPKTDTCSRHSFVGPQGGGRSEFKCQYCGITLENFYGQV